MKLKDIHIGTVIKQRFRESRLTVSQFAELIHCDRTTVYDIFKRKSVDIDRLMLISEALNYNFLWEVYLKNHPIGNSEPVVSGPAAEEDRMQHPGSL